MHRYASQWVPRVLLAALVALPATAAVAQDCSDPKTVNLDIATGIDADGDGLDDHWIARSEDIGHFAPAEIVEAYPGWRGSERLGESPFGTGRYPVLGDGRWIRPQAIYLGDQNIYRRSFVLEGETDFWIAGEWAADNAIRMTLNGWEIGIESSHPSYPVPPQPFLWNWGTHECTNPEDRLLYPNCDGKNPHCDRIDFVCFAPEYEFREIHYFELSTIDNPEWFVDGENQIEVWVGDSGVVTGFLLTGGVDTSVVTGASAGPCPPVRTCGALPGDPPPPCDCEMSLEVERTVVQPGERLAFGVEVLHKRSRRAERPLAAWIEDWNGNRLVSMTSAPQSFRYGERVRFDEALTVPQDLPAGRYKLVVGLQGMRQGMARRQTTVYVVELQDLVAGPVEG